MRFELIPNNGRKSFYGKAITTVYNGFQTLYSYNTPVASIDHENRFIRLWNGYSTTTMNHINAFRNLYNLPSINKSEWLALPIETSQELWNRIQEFNHKHA